MKHQTANNESRKEHSKHMFFRGLYALGFVLIPVIFLLGLPYSIVIGDPTEYTFVAHVLGIAHPPGYAFITLVGKLFQETIPFGSIAWRMHVLSATSATIAILCIYGSILLHSRSFNIPYHSRHLIALITSFTIAWATDFWQHAIHANPHIITATFLSFNLYLLTKWYYSTPLKSKWLYLLSFSVGLGITHHPLTAIAFPAYILFILLKLRTQHTNWRTLGAILVKCSAWGLVGLSLFLYFPLRSSDLIGTQFLSNMNTIDGFLDLTLARGLKGNLFYYGWADQLNRLLVFWTLLRLQYRLPIIILAVLGTGWLVRKGYEQRLLALLYGGAFLLNYLFTINTVQDVMAYLIGPFLLVGLLSGMGLISIWLWIRTHFLTPGWSYNILLGLIFILGPLLQVIQYGPLSLRDYREGEDYYNAIFEWFDDSSEGAVILNDWEHMTPLWYADLVEHRSLNESDARPVFVSAAKTWLDYIFEYLPKGSVYLSRFESSIFYTAYDLSPGFRLRPRGALYQVLEAKSPENFIVPSELTLLEDVVSEIEVVGYTLPKRQVTAGDYVPLTIALRVPRKTENYYVPALEIGDFRYQYTTDSHLLTPFYLPGEVVVERFDFSLPLNMAEGKYPVTLKIHQINGDKDLNANIDLGILDVSSHVSPPSTDHILANFRNEIGLVESILIHNRESVHAPWTTINARSSDTLHLIVKWEALAKPSESYTVFVHLTNMAEHPVILDYTPLGGASPTYLWFSKWLPGQEFLDPYRITLEGVPPGEYIIEVGLYEQFTLRRLYQIDDQGNAIGDRYILGKVVIEE
ncbi:MAG: hypothetical protein CSA11_07945 [Chloroflexi bacterium]|nr:MAG: hypothetical protein CSA11_07945 [Chloroflexota bacterium]